MEIIKKIALIVVFTFFSTKIIFTMGDIKQINGDNETDDINLAAIILTTIQEHENLKQLNTKNNKQKYYHFPTKIKKSASTQNGSNEKKFVFYVQNGQYENIISILDNPKARIKLPILSDSTAMLRLLCSVAASKKKLNKYNEDILATTFNIILNDEQIHQLFNAEQINQLLKNIVYKGTVSRLESFLAFDDFVMQISPLVGQKAMIVLAGRGHNYLLQTLLNNPIICSKIDKNSALCALIKAEAGQADRISRMTLCTLLENDIIYNLVKNLNLNSYLSGESLQFIYKKTSKSKVRYLIKKNC